MQDKQSDENLRLARERTDLAIERNRLANERTYFSWIRTGLATVGGGVAVLKLLVYEKFAHQILAQVMGFVLISLGILIFVLSFMDFKGSYKKLHLEKEYAANIWMMGLISVVLIFCAMVFLLIDSGIVKSMLKVQD